jgi:hypothetical protein
MKKVLVVLVMAALPVTATAAVYMINEGASSGGWSDANFNGSLVAYNPSPDPTAVETFWDDYAPVFGSPPSMPSALHFGDPWYSFTTVAGTGTRPGPEDEVRSTWGGGGIRYAGTSHIGVFRLGDAYWPNQIAGGVAYQFGGISRTEGAYNLTVDTLYHGRNPDEPLNNHNPGTAQWSVTAAPLALVSFFGVRYHGDTVDNKLNIGDIHMLRDSTLRGSLQGNEPSSLQISTRSHGYTDPKNLEINIGNIHLNSEILYLELTGGTTTISGDIGLEPGATSGNMITLLTGQKPATLGGAPLPSAVLNLKWAEMYEMIDAGQLYVFNAGLAYARTYLDGDADGFYGRLAAGTVRQITRDNMASELWISSLGADMASVRIIPEPASLLLLVLGGSALIRRRRA